MMKRKNKKILLPMIFLFALMFFSNEVLAGELPAGEPPANAQPVTENETEAGGFFAGVIKVIEAVNSTERLTFAEALEAIGLPDFLAVQQSADEGHQPWRINPDEAAMEFFFRELNLKGGLLSVEYPGDETARVTFITDGGAEIKIDLYQPATKGPGGIWAVNYWYDGNNQMHREIF